MQYLSSSVRSLPFCWQFAHNLLVAAAFASSSSACTASTPLNGNTNTAKMSATPLESASPTYTAGSSSMAFVTTPDKESAKKLARGIIEHKLAACVNIIPQIESIYMWEGKVNEDNEYLMMIKTRTTRVDELSKYVRENHPYSVAEVISVPIQNGNLPYLNWIAQTVPE